MARGMRRYSSGDFLCVLAIIIALLPATPLFAQVADTLSPGPNSPVFAIAIQPDGKILIGGGFTSVGGQARNGLAELNPDGTLNAGFNLPDSGNDVYALAIQPDGKILAAGAFYSFGGQRHANIARLNADGTLDSSFTAAVSNAVNCLVVQPDGKIVLGGNFTGVSGQVRKYIARLNADGSLDGQFNPGANNSVYTLALQPDGGIIAGGRFTSLASAGQPYLGRLTSAGLPDGSFNSGPDNFVYALAVQPDGKIVVGGRFATISGQSSSYIGRLNTDGTPDTTFGASADNNVLALALQADGKLLLGGFFTTLDGQPCARLGRLNPDGSLDTTFGAGASNSVYALALQADGKLLAGGSFAAIGGATRTNLARLTNPEAATQTLAFDNTSIMWLRADASPEVWRSSFSLTTNGLDWTVLGDGTRIAGGWQLGGLTLASNATLRASGWVTGGYYNGSGWIAETFAGFPAFTLQPASLTNIPNSVASFSAAAVGSPISYQWYKDGMAISDGPSFSGSATPTLTVSNIFGGDAGHYSVLASNSFGSITSAVASLTVLDPLITNQPVSCLVNAGQTAIFSVSATGTTPAYQWRKNGQSLANTTNTSLTLTNVQWADGGSFDVLVSNGFGCVTSVVANLTVNLACPDVAGAGADSMVDGFAEQPDGGLLVFGSFANLAGQGSTYLGRYDPAGILDPGFVSPVSGTFGSFTPGVWAVGMQLDSEFLIVGDFNRLNGQEHDRMGLLFADGTPDTNFTYGALDWVMSTLLQPDGQTLLGGSIIGLTTPTNTAYYDGMVRLSADGVPETNFCPNLDGYVLSLALQTNGQIILGGYVDSIGSTVVTNLARLFPDGTVDTNFVPSADNEVYALAMQADGKILVGGVFSTLCGQPRNQLGRLNSDGTLDTNFNPILNGVGPNGESPNYNVPFVESIIVQADGKILIGGMFTNLCGQLRSNLGRLNADGTLDATFNPWAEGIGSQASALALQSDGTVLVGGGFSTLAGVACTNFGRLNNTGPATRSLAFDGSTITWLRGGTAPEVYATIFDAQTDGTNWNSLGSGVRVPGGWQLAGISLPLNATLRARGFLTGGAYNASSWYVQQTLSGLSNTPPRILASNGGLAFGLNQFTFTLKALPGQAVVIEATTNFVQWVPLQTNLLTTIGQFLFSDSHAAHFPRRFYRARVFSGSLPPPAIQTDSALGLPAGSFGVEFSGIAGQTVVVEASTNLLNWTALSTNALGTVPLYFGDLNATNYSQRFYRLRQQ
jgi:uncharacterized delta-60 repeat protein